MIAVVAVFSLATVSGAGPTSLAGGGFPRQFQVGTRVGF